MLNILQLPKLIFPITSLLSVYKPNLPRISSLIPALPLTGLNTDVSPVKFYLYPFQRAQNYSEELKPCNRFSFDVSHFNSSLGLIVVTHGFMEAYTSTFPQKIKNAYLSAHFPANVILVDWNEFSQPNYLGLPPMNLMLGYPKASKYVVNTLGPKLSEFLVCLVKQNYVKDSSYIHLVGFSLGAQASGVAGHLFKQRIGQTIGRITGLDPAGVDFHLYPKERKLDANDAYFVDVVHSNQGAYGIFGSIGHVDFYPNGGGPTQPGCAVPVDKARDIPGLPVSCAHSRAWDFFIQSIRRSKIACKSDSLRSYFSSQIGQSCGSGNGIIFGQNVNITARGDYYFPIRVLAV